MASISDIRDRPKFFTWKKNYNASKLCEICKDHKIVVAVKWGCDFIITTDLQAKEKDGLKTHLHVWCMSDKGKPEGLPPQCFREYQDAGYCEM